MDYEETNIPIINNGLVELTPWQLFWAKACINIKVSEDSKQRVAELTFESEW